MPIVPFEQLTDDQRRQSNALFEALAHDDTEANWAKVDEWVGSLYGLRQRDVQTIRDSLNYSLPFATNRRAAEAPATREQITAFCAEVEAELAPWGEMLDRTFRAIPVYGSGSPPWQAVQIVAEAQSGEEDGSNDARAILDLADALAVTEVIEHDRAAGCLWLARLNQARYWTVTQARLVARRIIWEHVGFLKGEGAA